MCAKPRPAWWLHVASSMRGLLFLATLALAGCDFEIDILGDSEDDSCTESIPGYCLPEGISIRVSESYTDLDPAAEEVAALGGTVPVQVSGGDAGEGLEHDVAGAEVVSEEARGLLLRPLEESVTVFAAIGDLDDELVFAAHPVDAVYIAPQEQQFRLAEVSGPVEFAVARGSVVPVVIQLVGGDQRLIDTSLVARGDAVASQSRWDFVEVDAAADPIAIAIAGDSVDARVDIAAADSLLDSIEVVSGPTLSDPDAPIALSPAGEAAICFTGVADGRQIAGLDWVIDGAGVMQNDGCAFVDQFTSTLEVSAGGLSRSFQLDIER